MTMERRVRGNSHARCGAGENSEIISKSYLSLSHAAAYACLAYRTAYLKCHYYKEYMAALMTGSLDNTAKIIEYSAECEAHGVKLLTPDINESFEGFTAVAGGIRFALLAVKNLGKGAIASIIRERSTGGRYRSLEDFCSRVYGREINKRSVEGLIKCGAFDGLGLNRRQMLSNYESFLDFAGDMARNNLEGQLDFFSMSADDTPVQETVVPPMEEFPVNELLAMEKDTIGIYVSGHPVSQYIFLARACRMNTISDVCDELVDDGKEVCMLVMLQGVKPYTTKKGDAMAFMQIEDITGAMEAIAFPDMFAKARTKIVKDNVVAVKGRISLRDDEVPKIILSDVLDGKEFEEICSKKSLRLKIADDEIEKGRRSSEILMRNRGNADLIYINQKKCYKNYCKISNSLISELAEALSIDNIFLI
ncbi:MAG: hypothetical protein E7507_08645 [Ruminococcus sp.]|nr:hypothetical protein [Ruminococcus sp.]